MKTYIYNNRFLFTAIALFLIALIIDKNQLENNNYEIDIDKFENVLHKKENKLDEILDIFEQKITNKDFQQINSGKNIFFDTDFSYINDEGFDVLIYQNDTLKYWTSNLFDIEKTFSNSVLNSKIANLNNAWYELKYIDLNETIIVGLIKIKNQYQFENDFIINNFEEGFDLPASLKISKIPLSFSFEIENAAGEYIFSIVPSNTIITPKNHSVIAGILYLISFIIFIFHLNIIFGKYIIEKSKTIWIPIISVIIILCRILMLKYKIPVYVYSLDIFDPSHYAQSFVFASLGDFIINSLLLGFFVYYIFRFLNLEISKKVLIQKTKTFKIVISTLIFLTISFYFLFIQNILKGLIEDSSISFEIYNILSLDLYSVIAFLTYSMLLGTFIYITDEVISVFRKKLSFELLIISISITILLCLIITSILPGFNFISAIYLLLIFLAITLIRFKQVAFKFYSYVLIVLITTIYTVFFLTTKITDKQKVESKLLVNQLINERDVLAELLLQDIKNEIVIDETIISYAQKPDDDRTDDKIETYIKQKYFNGYWNKYYLDVSVFSDIDSLKNKLYIETSDNTYIKKLEENGIKLDDLDAYFIDNKDGSISYILQQNYLLADSLHNSKIFIELDSKILPNELGYPELLIDQTIKPSVFQDYSYVKYKGDTLISKSGINLFNFNYSDYKDTKEQYTFESNSKFRNLIFKADDNTFIILTEARIYIFDILISFAYLFIFFNILLICFALIRNFNSLSTNFIIDYKNKLIFSMIFILLLSFILIGGTTVYYNVIQYKNKHNENIQDKIQSISLRLEQEVGHYDSIGIIFDGKELSYLDYLLRDISEVFFSDVNLYNLNGDLIATSRPEIYNKYLIGNRIDQKAFYQLATKNKTEFINNEKIGNLEFTSAYITLKNINNKDIAYINVPYFIKPSILQKEISNLLVTIVNMYVILFIVAMVVAIILSEQLVSPLRMLQNKFRKIELGKKYEIIDYRGKDEIGDLVKEYNRMVQKLEENISLLAKSERESAWREMAKQVAHEIKNPLTPMKLKIQYLQKSWDNKDENFEKKFREVSENIIEQIETLSKIATEFSSFAKIPVPKEEIFNIVSSIETIAQLYENTENIEIITNLNQNKNISIIADKEQVSRVFINLVKNAIQSIPDGVKGKINIDLITRSKSVIISIEDNGSGISDETKKKLFQPSFTTKSSGMGLGLSIVKNIVNSAGGDIWFETILGQGTKFYVEFPLCDENL